MPTSTGFDTVASKDLEELRLARLSQIAEGLSRREEALALLGLGSVGRDVHRLDRYSDLDFFVIVEPGHKARYIENLDWLSEIGPLGFSFRNTIDGHKALYDDGVFCEFAVFEPSELRSIPFDHGRVIWSRDGFDADLLAPPPREPEFGEDDENFLLGELLTNLYVGMGRYARGERLSACFFVQHHAVMRLISLLELWGEAGEGSGDPFSNERRFEQRFGDHIALIESLTPGYLRTPGAAQRMLDFLGTRVNLNEQLVTEIRRLISEEAE